MDVSISTYKVEAREFSIEIGVLLPKCKVYNFYVDTFIHSSYRILAKYWKSLQIKTLEHQWNVRVNTYICIKGRMFDHLT